MFNNKLVEKLQESYPLERMKKMLEGEGFSDLQILEIRDFLINLADIQIYVFQYNEEKENNKTKNRQ